VGTPEVISALLLALRDNYKDVRRSAAYALGEIKASTSEVINGLLLAIKR
jgi:HEAT repeat protein